MDREKNGGSSIILTFSLKVGSELMKRSITILKIIR
jgi:hypothetical protein